MGGEKSRQRQEAVGSGERRAGSREQGGEKSRQRQEAGGSWGSSKVNGSKEQGG